MPGPAENIHVLKPEGDCRGLRFRYVHYMVYQIVGDQSKLPFLRHIAIPPHPIVEPNYAKPGYHCKASSMYVSSYIVGLQLYNVTELVELNLMHRKKGFFIFYFYIHITHMARAWGL